MGLAPIARNLVADYFSKNRRDDHRPPLSAMAAYLPTLDLQSQPGCPWGRRSTGTRVLGAKAGEAGDIP